MANYQVKKLKEAILKQWQKQAIAYKTAHTIG